MSGETPVLRWRVGDVTITRIVEMEMTAAYHPQNAPLPEARPEALADMPWLRPHFVTQEGHLRMAIQALVVQAPGLTLVVDTCIGNDKPRRMTRGVGLNTGFLKTFEAQACPREAVDVVLCTHLHVDHVGWNTMRQGDAWVPTFPRARYLIAKPEIAHWRAEGDADQAQILANSIQPIFDAGLAELVDLDHRISPEIDLVPTTGHTPGHVSVRIVSRGETAIITGDMMHHPCQIGRPHWSSAFDVDPAAARATRIAQVAHWADQPILVIGTHFASPTAGRVRRDGDAFRFDID